MTMRSVAVLFTLISTLALAQRATAQVFEVPWYSIDGGAGPTLSGGVFEIVGTIGQPDAGAAGGAAFEVESGFWAITRSDASAPCLGDIDDDGAIGITDLAFLLSAFGTCTGDPLYNARTDFDGSGCVDLGDLTVMLSLFGTFCP